MKTWKEVARHYAGGMDVCLWINLLGVYFYCILFGCDDIPAVVLFAGLNIVIILATRFDEIKKDFTPKDDPDEIDKIIRRVK